MQHRRSGFTLIEIILLIAVVALLAGGVMLWMRVQTLNTWAVNTQAWNKDVYRWINESSFAPGTGGGNPDSLKPPPPPGDL